MANCVSCGISLPAASWGKSDDRCVDCRRMAAQPTVLSPEGVVQPQPLRVRTTASSLGLSVTTVLVGINVAVFVMMALSGVSILEPNLQQLLKWGANWGPLSLGSQPWRVLTSNYEHIGIIHIFFNMWCLLNLGALAERVFDRWTYILIYTASGLAGSLASLWWHPMVVGAGASGAIFGLAGALLSALYLGKLPLPKEGIRATMKSLLMFAAYNLFFGLTQGIDNAAHLGGLASGLALGAFLSTHLTGPAEVRQRRRNLAFVLSLFLLSVSLYYVRHQHKEFTAIADPHDYVDQYGKALDAFRQKDYANAVSACQKLVQLNPTSAEAHFLLGVAFEASESPDSAIPEFQEALRLNPKYSQAATGLAEAY